MRQIYKDNLQVQPSRLGLDNTLTAFLQRTNTPPPAKKCYGYDTKQSDGEAPILELWDM